MRNATTQTESSQRGVVLVEAMVAILIFSVGVLAVAGLQATMITNTADSKYRSDAGYIAQRQLGMMWADPDNLANYVVSASGIPGLLPAGKVTTALNGTQVTVTVQWQQPGHDAHNLVMRANIAQSDTP